ncbi:hypothetical protein TBS_06850 [Thermobispora bispora]|uniref:Uncharacterized protein n=1 Tax=Thermobispora bispora (strain ATCC 19993 / DSM 43833 / CBS 139.67 / JCM 10125 / KCTC 9307 / NBRC 14880 / R51) TaxID=469371 RepID=D6YB31_THEBD|nr:hypothetical protein [Thermobispora bispora]ADG88391.1 hypothetical protein Tbis_1678 [Thermobispora bispora DSM 43833]QSI48210.1 hypothetical protein CYL17_10410 [Thermobispora bispora]
MNGDEESTPAHRERMLCPSCLGSGRVIVDRAAVLGLSAGTAGVNEQCTDCFGEGFLHYETRIARPCPPGSPDQVPEPPEPGVR